MRLLIGISVVLLSGPLAAQGGQPAETPDYDAMTVEELAVQIDTIGPNASLCAAHYPLYREIAERRPDLPELVSSAREMEIICTLRSGEYSKANHLVQQWEADGSFTNDNLGLWAAAAAEDGEAGVSRLRKAFRAGSPESYGGLDEDLVWAALREVRAAGLGEQADDILYEVVEAGEVELFPSILRATIASGAIDVSARRGDLEAAEAMLRLIDNPVYYDRYLARREYASIWPAVEARVGPNYRTITREFREARVAQWRAATGNLENLHDAAGARLYDGDWHGVVALADEALARPDLMETLEEDEGWVLNLKAYAFDALGRRDEADRIFDDLARLDPAKHPWVVNFAINRGSRLVGQGRWMEGLAAAEMAEEIARKYGSPYARALTARDKICALHNLGRPDDYSASLEFLRREASDHTTLLAGSLQCIGRDDEAASLIANALRDDLAREDFMESLQPQAFDLFYTRSILPKPRDLLATHPELREEFLKHARLIPEQFYPAASLTR